jgi:hypothetical protein
MSNSNPKPGLRSKQKLRIGFKHVIIVSGSFFFLFTVGMIIYFQLGRTEDIRAAVNGDYRSISSGNWNTASIWERYNGSAWVSTATPPSSSNNIIQIQSGHQVIITAAVTIDQTLVDAGGTLILNSGITLTVAKGSGKDITVNGNMDIYGSMSMNTNSSVDINSAMNLKSTGTIIANTGAKLGLNGTFTREGGTIPTSASSWLLGSSAIFNHAMDGGSIPALTWTAGSTCEVSGILSTVPGNISQTFSNFKWNCSSQTSNINFSGALASVTGNFNINNTGTAILYLDMQGNNSTLNVTGNLNMQGGQLCLCVNGATSINVTGNVNVTGGTLMFNEAGGVAYGNTSAVITITGSLNVTGGTVDMSRCTANNSSKGNGTINLSGDLVIKTPGVVTETSDASEGTIYIAGNTTQTASVINTITQTINVTVNSGAVLRMDNAVTLSGLGDFTLLPAGGLIIGSSDGIAATEMKGNVQLTGIRSFSTGADYTYNGISTQESGDGLPSQVRNLTLNNSNNCTLSSSTSASGTMTFTTGNWITSNDTLTLGISTATTGTLSRVSGHVVGHFRRWVNTSASSNILFPVGTLNYYNGANFSYTIGPASGGSITCNLNVGNVGSTGLPINDGGDICTNIGYAYWTFASANGYNGGIWNVNLVANGFPGIEDYTKLHVFRRTNASAAWAVNGVHTAGTGSNSSPVGNRTAMTILGQYGITSGNANPLPVQLTFFKAQLKNKSVELKWTTASEINNDYFDIERSENGVDFISIGIVKGSGNSTATLNYFFSDFEPVYGISYYRLKQVDFDGRTSLSPSEKIDYTHPEEVKSSPVNIESIGPNPFSSSFTINYSTDNDFDVAVEIISFDGRSVFKTYQESNKGFNSFNFRNGENLPDGEYLLRISGNNGVSIKKLTKRA